MAELVITIDGPAGSGKSTAARLLAERMGAAFLDTGAMYRAVTLAAMRAGVDLKKEEQLLRVLVDYRFGFEISAAGVGMRALIDGEDVTEEIRRPDVTANARYIASKAAMRERLVEMQRGFASGQKRIVTEGRDQGTVAFPDADVKFFLVADLEERARRRQAELLGKGIAETAEQVRSAIEKRDISDSSREVGPLKAAADAVVVDTTGMDIEKMVEELERIVRQRCSEKS